MPRAGALFVGSVVAVLVAATTSACGAPGPKETDRPAPGHPTLRVLQYNLCGAAAHCTWNAGGSGADTSVARVVSEARDLEPDIITLNEICLTQYASLKRQLAAAGRRMDGTYASFHDNVPNCGGTGQYGEAVLSRTDVPDDVQDFRPFVHTGGERYTNAGRTVPVHRGLLCAHTRFAGRPLTACTAHAYAGAPEQLREIRDWTLEPSRDTPTVMAGDLNLPPDSSALDYLTPHFAEADHDEEPTADGRKIDYVFADRRHFTVVTGDARKFPESDHALLTGQFTFDPQE
ncbi:endonuclease/exonuclease/phosphatase family protein [Streptomyces sp. NPDC058371]|uniref:endonuclease/exonuclease/phosphatase family protein n=1 Tax=Streptomyces sp. NPDC058371 TaxID=3346463 RepID=UPI00364673CF